MPNPIAVQFRNQWRNPADILSLLLLIGGDIVQKAIAQLVGYSIPSLGIPLVPVAFSFGWVAMGFSQLVSAVGERRLMPAPESEAFVINCANTFQRTNKSWVLERLLRDHEIIYRKNERNLSLRIDIFELGALRQPKRDSVWWLGWLTTIAQISIAIPPWVLNGDWGIMLITLSGAALAFASSSLPQWKEEKWAGRDLEKDNVLCLTRGNGHRHAMIILGTVGSPDLEVYATAMASPRAETPIATFILAALWVCLLLCVSAVKDDAWYLVGIGGLGMLQNVYAAGKTRHPDTTGLNLRKFERMPTIIGRHQDVTPEQDANVNLDEASQDVAALHDWVTRLDGHKESMPSWLNSMQGDGVPAWLAPLGKGVAATGVHGALKELEKWVPGAGPRPAADILPWEHTVRG